MEQVLLVMTNLPDVTAGKKMAHALIQSRLVACVNLLPGVQSIYRWQGQVEEASEIMLQIKTTTSRYQQLQQAILDAHPYALPEVIAIPVSYGHAPYLHWIASETIQEKNA
jgi:periplasmic divalent cation tolerance protein